MDIRVEPTPWIFLLTNRTDVREVLSLLLSGVPVGELGPFD